MPIDLMAALQRGDLRGTNEYAKGRLGTEYVVRCEGGDLAAYDAQELLLRRADRGLRRGPRGRPAQVHRGDRRAGVAQGHPGARPPRARRDRRQDQGEARAVGAARGGANRSEAAEDRDPRSKWISPWEPRRPGAGLFPAPAGKSRR